MMGGAVRTLAGHVLETLSSEGTTDGPGRPNTSILHKVLLFSHYSGLPSCFMEGKVVDC